MTVASYEAMNHNASAQLEQIWDWLADRDALLGVAEGDDVASVAISLLDVLIQYISGDRQDPATVRLLDEFDRYASSDAGYRGSPFEGKVRAFLTKQQAIAEGGTQ